MKCRLNLWNIKDVIYTILSPPLKKYARYWKTTRKPFLSSLAANCTCWGRVLYQIQDYRYNSSYLIGVALFDDSGLIGGHLRYHQASDLKNPAIVNAMDDNWDDKYYKSHDMSDAPNNDFISVSTSSDLH
jgi:hypothetical protein